MQVAASLLEFAASHHCARKAGEGRAFVREHWSVFCEEAPAPGTEAISIEPSLPLAALRRPARLPKKNSVASQPKSIRRWMRSRHCAVTSARPGMCCL